MQLPTFASCECHMFLCSANGNVILSVTTRKFALHPLIWELATPDKKLFSWAPSATTAELTVSARSIVPDLNTYTMLGIQLTMPPSLHKFRGQRSSHPGQPTVDGSNRGQ